MKIKEVLDALERFAPLPLQDGYDNAGLQIGLTDAEVSGALLCLDVTEEVIDEAVEKGCNLVVSHHPLLFRGLKCIAGRSYIERCVMKAIKHDVVLYAAHTNLDNAPQGVNRRMSRKLGLQNETILEPKGGFPEAGAGMIGYLPKALSKAEFLELVKQTFHVGCVLHNCPEGVESIRKVALCGGAGSFLAERARHLGADAFLTGEVKYHEFFGYPDLLVAAIGHYESEQYTKELLKEIIERECPGVKAVLTSVNTNPIHYY